MHSFVISLESFNPFFHMPKIKGIFQKGEILAVKTSLN